MEPNFIGFTFEPATEAMASLGGTHITAWSDRSIGTNEDLRAWVGDQELVGVTIDQFGLFVEGWVESPPDPTDTFFYQLPGTDKIDTGLTAVEDPLIT